MSQQVSKHFRRAKPFNQAEFDQLKSYRDQVALGNYSYITQYYSLLASKDYTYADLALGVWQENTLSGVIARSYADQVASEVGQTIVWDDLSTSLAIADFGLREQLWSGQGCPASFIWAI